MRAVVFSRVGIAAAARAGGACAWALPAGNQLPSLVARRPCAEHCGAPAWWFSVRCRGWPPPQWPRLAGAAPRQCLAFGDGLAATRQRGEPAWHRRARRGRADARVLVRLGAAKARLAAHHSAAFGGMFRGGGGRFGGGHGGAFGGGGGGAGGGVNTQADRQLLFSLFGEAMGGQQRGRTGQRNQRAGSRRREGEWACSCGFETNRPQRTECFACGRSRGAASLAERGGGRKGGGKGGGTRTAARSYLSVLTDGRGGSGPIGAGGSRPMLGTHGAADRANARGAGGDDATGKGCLGKSTGSGTALGKASSVTGGKAKGKGPWTKGGMDGKGLGKDACGGTADDCDARDRMQGDDEGVQVVQPRGTRDQVGGQKRNTGG